MDYQYIFFPGDDVLTMTDVSEMDAKYCSLKKEQNEKYGILRKEIERMQSEFKKEFQIKCDVLKKEIDERRDEYLKSGRYDGYELSVTSDLQDMSLQQLAFLADQCGEKVSREKTHHGDGGQYHDGWFNDDEFKEKIIERLTLRSCKKCHKILCRDESHVVKHSTKKLVKKCYACGRIGHIVKQCRDVGALRAKIISSQ